MHILLVNGSPNRGGCTHRALTEIAKTLNTLGIDTEEFWTGNKPASGCLGCRQCEKLGRCVIDDRVHELSALAKKADGFVFGSPVHYAAPAGVLVSLMARAFISDLAGNGNRSFRLKPAAAVVSARRSGTTAAFDQLNKYFTIQEMPVISSSYWNAVHGDTPAEVEQDTEGLRTMRVLARNMAYHLRCKEAGERAGVALPEQEPPVFTNFIR